MVYAGKLGDRTVHMGVSGRLLGVEESRETGIDVRNLVMWDPQTGSMWGQLRGEALQGPAKGEKLDLLPAVFVGLGTWKLIHPETAVLDLEPVPGSSWHFTDADLARGKASDMEIAIALRAGDETLAVPMSVLHERGVVNVEVGGNPVAVVWHAGSKAAFAYERRAGDRVVELELVEGLMHEAGGEGRWDPLTGKAPPQGGAHLPRFPYIPSFLPAWTTYYPRGEVFDG